MLIKSCWAPCFTAGDGNSIELKEGCRLIALYTGFLHVLSTYYFVHVYLGGSSDAFFSPLFELSLIGTQSACVFLSIYSLLYILFAYMLVKGLRQDIRFLYWPWLVSTFLELFVLYAFGFFVVYRYYHYSWATLAWTLIWFYASIHAYMYWAIVSQYSYVKYLQEPTFLILMP